MKNKKLVIFTSSFPFDNSEVSFLLPEVNVLAAFFSDIYLVPYKNDALDCQISLPSNVQIWQSLIKGKYKQKRKLGDYLFVLKLFFIELKKSKEKRLIKNFRYHISELFVYLQKAKNLEERFRIENVDVKNYLFYSYWFDEWTSTLAMFKSRSSNPINMVSRAHGFDIYDERDLKGYIFPRQMQLDAVSKVFSISQDGAGYLKRKFPRSADKIDFSRLGIVKIFADSNEKLISGDLVIVSCSSIIGVKRIHKIVELLNHTTRQIKWIHFGDGNNKEEILKMAESLPKNVKADFKGNVENSLVTKFYSENFVDWFINVSEYEGIPVSIMEAISYGIPVIATNVGGTKEIVNNVTGFLIDKEFNPKEIISIIEQREFSMPQRALIMEFWEKNYEAKKNFTDFAEKLLKISAPLTALSENN